MVKPDRNSAWSDVDGDSVPRDQRPRMVDFNATTAHHFHGEGMKRVSLRQGFEELLEIIQCHEGIIPA